ncbi:MAG: glycosyltransferase family 39 protein [Elusimicrobia bacterium]|nr:glycosyltransferase family 39 protein [Elusimicrobiota bacterium]
MTRFQFWRFEGAKPSRALWVFFAVALLSPFWGLGHPLIEVDDARYAEVPREMVETGDWATPHLDYLDYVEKPPLWYWLAASSYKVFGVSEATARLPLALLSIVGLLALAWLGSWLYSPRVGVCASVILASSGLYFFLSHYITPDLPLTVFLLLTTAMILRCLTRPSDGRWAGPAAWFFAALAFLSKGLVAAIFPAIWTSALLFLFPQWRKGLRGLLNPLGPAVFLAVVSPWFLLMERRHPGFLHVFFVEQHFQRFITQKYNRSSPWYFFLLVLPAGLLPWTPAALASLARGPRHWRAEPRDAALALWSVLVVGFFSSSQSKLATYILPVFPHLALLVASSCQRPLPVWSKRLSWVLGAALLGAVLAGPSLFPELYARADAEPLAVALKPFVFAAALALGTGLAAAGFSQRDSLKRLAAAGLAVGALALGAFSAGSGWLSAKELARSISGRFRPGDAIYAYGIYLHGVPFYTGRRVDKVVNWVGELHYAMRDPANADRFGDERDIAGLPLEGKRVFVSFPRDQTNFIFSVTGPERLKGYAAFGPWGLAEF